ncbi:MAG: hypothetical protein HY454_02725 [Parcubacteria group bacterium]|nr:hypothetical protein [Parcubacteria group bacterium]
MKRMKRSSVGLLVGLVLVWAAMEFWFLARPEFSDQAIRATIEKTVRKRFGAWVLWEVKEPILLKSTPVSPAERAKVKPISTSAMRDFVGSAYQLGVDLIHLKQSEPGAVCQFFLEDKDAVFFAPPAEAVASYLEGAEIDDGEIRLHFHKGSFYKVYANGTMSPLSIFGLRNAFPFWEVQLIYPKYLALRAVPYVLWFGLVLAVVSAAFRLGCYFGAKTGSKSKPRPVPQKAALAPEFFPGRREERCGQSDSLPEDAPLAPGDNLVLSPVALVSESGGNGDRAALTQKSLVDSRQARSPSQEKIDRAIRQLESLKRKTRAEAVRSELDFMLAELHSGRHGVPGARLFLKRAQALTQTSARIKPVVVKPDSGAAKAHIHTHLPSLSGEEIVGVLMKVGYQHERYSRSHFFLKCVGRPSVSIPKHDDIYPDRFRGILKKAGISLEEFSELYYL